MDMPIRIKRSFFYFKLNVIVEIRLLAKFDYCTIYFRENESPQINQTQYIPDLSLMELPNYVVLAWF